jgi:hypothetical protein
MATRAHLRASDADRDRAADRLRVATAEGRLTAEELEERMRAALSARTYGELDALVADLPEEHHGAVAPGRDGSPPVAAPAHLPATRTNGLAIASLVLGFFWLWGLGSLLALAFGIIAKRQIERSRGHQNGRGLAIAGIVLGTLGVLGAVGSLIGVAVSFASLGLY